MSHKEHKQGRGGRAQKDGTIREKADFSKAMTGFHNNTKVISKD